MDKRRTIDQILISIAAIGILVFLNRLIGAYMGSEAIPYVSFAMIIAGSSI